MKDVYFLSPNKGCKIVLTYQTTTGQLVGRVCAPSSPDRQPNCFHKTFDCCVVSAVFLRNVYSSVWWGPLFSISPDIFLMKIHTHTLLIKGKRNKLFLNHKRPCDSVPSKLRDISSVHPRKYETANVTESTINLDFN